MTYNEREESEWKSSNAELFLKRIKNENKNVEDAYMITLFLKEIDFEEDSYTKERVDAFLGNCYDIINTINNNRENVLRYNVNSLCNLSVSEKDVSVNIYLLIKGKL